MCGGGLGCGEMWGGVCFELCVGGDWVVGRCGGEGGLGYV